MFKGYESVPVQINFAYTFLLNAQWSGNVRFPGSSKSAQNEKKEYKVALGYWTPKTLDDVIICFPVFNFLQGLYQQCSFLWNYGRSCYRGLHQKLEHLCSFCYSTNILRLIWATATNFAKVYHQENWICFGSEYLINSAASLSTLE